MDNSYYQAGGSGTFGLAWSNEAPAIRQDMIEGRLDHVPAINKLDCWLQLLLTAVLCLHPFDLNFKGLDFSACQAVHFKEFARGHQSHPSLLPHHLTCSVRVCCFTCVFWLKRATNGCFQTWCQYVSEPNKWSRRQKNLEMNDPCCQTCLTPCGHSIDTRNRPAQVARSCVKYLLALH